ncbi:RNase adapter RapZ [Proteiniclasticum sp. QWL-01]|uniref:RNase adapter RapZ n=1 Tax=Proteiniclasticum sp. QWL-01 TaxID=3036945 RepID=UPI00241170B0|nr:RNase adapter RapZ [Proteiniclasticum sp. QWL-01]WFF73622.1 RNase adapter RapZ [Proteiniclasticum sp. QWL-01]
MKIVIITGMSGAGKSQAVKVFEDLGYYVVDNLPPNLLGKFIDVLTSAEGKITDAALVMDIRSGQFFHGIDESIDDLAAKNIAFEILFLDAEDEEIVTRFKETRRVHPLSSRERLLNGIQKEREILQPIKDRADFIIDTTGLPLHKFQEKIKNRYVMQEASESLNINVVSFGFKYGVPVDADLIFDVRFIENPFYIDELRPLSGQDEPVRQFVLGNDVTKEFMTKVLDMLKFLIPHYILEGKKQLIVGIGCTGGRHRSVAITEEITRQLRYQGFHAASFHRDSEEDVARKHRL